MNRYAVLVAVGPDRPGLVDAISQFIFESGGNLEDSRMAVLGGEFAVLVLVSGAEGAVQRVLEGAEAAGRSIGLTMHARPTRSPGEAASTETLPYELSAFALDHPGIVTRVAHYLGEQHINVRAMETRVAPAPVSGQPLFSLHAVIDLPRGSSVRALRRDLDALGDVENIDIELRPLKE